MKTLFRHVGKAGTWVFALALLLAVQPVYAHRCSALGLRAALHCDSNHDAETNIAARYDISRGKDRALCNISVIDKNGAGVKAALEGSSQNLLGQRQGLTFTEVVDGEAIYYLATIRHANEEVHRINVDAQVAGTPTSRRQHDVEARKSCAGQSNGFAPRHSQPGQN